MTTAICRWDSTAKKRVVTDRHARDCTTSGCPGCQTCTERHCQVCRHTHVTVDGRGTDQTCARCLGETRTHLADIWTLSTALLGEALARGIRSAVANLAGPVADVETWSNRRASVLAGRLDPSWLTEQGKELSDDDVPHPLWVLATWEREVRIHLDQVLSPGTSRPTLTEARDYLEHHLTWLAHDGEFDFAGLATALRDCRNHLERAVQLEEHHDTGAPCPACGRGRLRKDYGASDEDDRWTCPRCQQWWSEEDYRAKVAGTYVAVASALTASQIREQYRVPEATIRKWAERGKVKRRGRDQHGRQLYDVADVLARRDGVAAS
jgi:transposase-like protein